jgi:hypothetical protein
VERTTIAGETEILGENLPQRHFVPPQIPHDQVQFRTPDRSGGKPATNRLSYGAAFNMDFYRKLITITWLSVTQDLGNSDWSSGTNASHHRPLIGKRGWHIRIVFKWPLLKTSPSHFTIKLFREGIQNFNSSENRKESP